MALKRLRKGRRKVGIGQMRDRVTLQNRAIQPPTSGLADFDLAFTDTCERWAAVNTVDGKTMFDGVQGTDIPVTHEVLMRMDTTVTIETWVLTEASTRLDILKVEPFDERSEFMRLTCRESGESAKEASKL